MYVPYEPKRNEHICSSENICKNVIIIFICNGLKLQTTQLSIN